MGHGVVIGDDKAKGERFWRTTLAVFMVPLEVVCMPLN